MEKLELQLIEAYANENYHNEALMIKAIKHKEDGHLSQDNYNKRYEIEKELF